MDEKVYDKAVKLLSIRLHTTGELQRKLQRYGFADTAIREVLGRLEDLRFLDDQRFAEIFVDNLKRFKDFGYHAIRAKLHQRHIPSSMANAALEEFFTPADELAVARKLVAKLKRQKEPSYQQLAGSLARRGFRAETISKVLRGGD